MTTPRCYRCRSLILVRDIDNEIVCVTCGRPQPTTPAPEPEPPERCPKGHALFEVRIRPGRHGIPRRPDCRECLRELDRAGKARR